MSMFHRHSWKVTKKIFNPPKGQLKRTDNISANFSFDLRCVIFGFTTVSYRCSCGRLKTERLIGDHHD